MASRLLMNIQCLASRYTSLCYMYKDMHKLSFESISDT